MTAMFMVSKHQARACVALPPQIAARDARAAGLSDSFLRKSRPKGVLLRQGWWPLALWTGLILLVVLPWTTFQNHTHWPRVQWIPFVTPPVKLRDIAVNLLLYAPWGYFGARAMRSRRVWIVVALAAVLSLVTEASQLYSHGRFPSATDLTCNILGACAGAMYERSRTRSGTM